MLNIEEIAINAVKTSLNSEKLQKTIEEQIENTITERLNSFFRSYSDFGKSFEKALEEQLKLDLNNLGITEYNHYITTTIRDRFNKHIEGPAINQIDNLLNDICPTAGETYQFDDLVNRLSDAKSDYDSDHCGRFAIQFMRHSEWYMSDYINIGFDADADTDSWLSSSSDKEFKDCSCSIKVCVKTGKVVGFDIGHNGNDKTAKVRTWKHDFESLLFRLYASGSVIDFGDIKEQVLDMEPGDELSGYDLDIETSYEWAMD